MKKQNFSSLENLEFEVLEDFGNLPEEPKTDFKKLSIELNETTQYFNLEVYEVIYLDKQKEILILSKNKINDYDNNTYNLIQDDISNYNLNLNDLILTFEGQFEEAEKKVFCKIDRNINFTEYINIQNKIKETNGYTFLEREEKIYLDDFLIKKGTKHLTQQVLNEIIEELKGQLETLNKRVKKREEEIKKREEKRKKELEEAEKKELEKLETLILNFNNGEDFEISSKTTKDNYYKSYNETILKVRKNELKFKRLSLEFEKPINKIYSFKELKELYKKLNAYYTYTDDYFIFIENIIKTKKENFVLKQENKDDIKIKIDFDENIFINEVKIRKGNLPFILRNAKKNLEKQEIKNLNTLSLMKIDFLNLERIEFYKTNYYDRLNIPIKNEIINDKTFKVKFINKVKNLGWDEVKEFFFCNDTSRSINRSFWGKDLIAFTNFMKIDKKDLFNYLKKLQLLKGLENENKDN